MKITHAISDSNVGGAGILLASVITGLKDDFEFEVIIPKNSKLKKRLPSDIKITELCISNDKSFSPADVKTFRDYFRKNPTDIVHTHASLSARIGGKIAGIGCCISTRHCACPEAKVKRKAPATRFLYEMSTDLTVSTADFATKNLIKEGLKKEKIVTIKNGSPDLSKQTSDDNFCIRTSLGIPHDARIIGCVARLERVKGQDLLLRSAREILKFFPDVYFLFIGSGSMKNEYLNMASRLGIEKNVGFSGYVERPYLYQKNFYINVNPSRGTETSCLATSECMSLGIPTVASSFGGNTEMIESGVNGIVFNTDNVFSLSSALIELLEDEELYRRLSVGARRVYLEKFSLSRMKREYKNMYLSVSG